MEKRFCLLTLSIILLSCAGATPKMPVYQSETLRIYRISEHVYHHISFIDTEEWGKVACNGMIVAHQNEALVFDTTPDDESSHELIQWITNMLNSRVIAVIPTHSHIDNLGGLAEFHRQNIPSFAFYRTIQFARESGATVPQNGFDNYLEMKVGGKKVIAQFFGEGHTRDNIVGYFPTDNVLFGGCLITGGGKGNLAEANVEAWSETVRNVKHAFPNIQTVIPGHGTRGGIELLEHTIRLFSIEK